MKKPSKQYITEVSGSPGSGKAHITFSSGATSNDMTVDWNEINRVLATF